MAAHLAQAVSLDGRHRAMAGPVIQGRRRLQRLKLQVDADGVSLVRPNAGAVLAQGEALLVTLGDDLFELLPADGEASGRRRLEQRLDHDPAARLERQPEVARAVPQIQAQVFADPDMTTLHLYCPSC